MPITITRTYDTLDSAYEGDFGFGWMMNFRDVKLQTSTVPPGTQSGFGRYPAFRAGTRVWITLPGGMRERQIKGSS